MKNIYDTLFEAQLAAVEAKRSEPAVRDDPVRAVQMALELCHRHINRHGPPTGRPNDEVRTRETSEAVFLRLAGIGGVILTWVDARSEDQDRAMAERLVRLLKAVDCVLDTGRLPDGTKLHAVPSAWTVACDALTASIRPLANAADDPTEREEASRHVTQAVVASVSGAWMLGRA